MDQTLRRDRMAVELFATAAIALPEVLRAACLRDADLLAEAIRVASSDDDPDGRFLLADAIAVGIVGALGLAGKVGAIDPAVDARSLFPWPPEVIIMDEPAYAERLLYARRYLLYYMIQDFDGMMELTDRHGPSLLYALAEWNTALCTAGVLHGH